MKMFYVCSTSCRTELLVDRQLMVVDRKGKMITARRYPVMILIQPQMTSANSQEMVQMKHVERNTNESETKRSCCSDGNHS